ncbi:DUF2280 domain-containing protein [Pararhizobium mangrovi]|uniref:DUF2280 domain-containing protein n=1 Tax=Pararhizobium mangrovi TaxID=2590452 RepID=A0A506TYG6_9HYPH|nr:DUF2280 domain-containing protein [Pararhizobium mangrovi]TPW26021.1 DUF2280 domain-containing protein [Pararhizobium mangrovi]
MAKGKLPDAVRTFIVQSLACFDTPSTVVAAVRSEFDHEVTRQTVEGYDPTKRAGQGVSEKWRTLFEETRKAFIENTAQIGISHKAVRLRALQRMAEKAEQRGNMPLAASLLEQAAKEVGEAYTNRHKLEHSGPNGGPIQTEETRARDIIAGKLARLTAGSGTPGGSGEPE